MSLSCHGLGLNIKHTQSHNLIGLMVRFISWGSGWNWTEEDWGGRWWTFVHWKKESWGWSWNSSSHWPWGNWGWRNHIGSLISDWRFKEPKMIHMIEFVLYFDILARKIYLLPNYCWDYELRIWNKLCERPVWPWLTLQCQHVHWYSGLPAVNIISNGPDHEACIDSHFCLWSSQLDAAGWQYIHTSRLNP